MDDRWSVMMDSVFGDDLTFLKSNRGATFERLKSHRWSERIAALWLLDLHWHLSTEVLLPLCENMIVTDPEPQVRSTAATVIGKSHEHTFDRAASRVLAKAALDTSQPTEVRGSAVLALRAVNREVLEEHEMDLFRSRIRQDIDMIRDRSIGLSELEWVRDYL